MIKWKRVRSRSRGRVYYLAGSYGSSRGCQQLRGDMSVFDVDMRRYLIFVFSW